MIPVPEAPKLSADAETQLELLRKYCASLSEWLSLYFDTQDAELYPIGSLFTSTETANPADMFGGSWLSEGCTQLAGSGLTAYIWRRTA